jgi:5-hydroxyisourate hydrolase-like protein (transthyretin family)
MMLLALIASLSTIVIVVPPASADTTPTILNSSWMGGQGVNACSMTGTWDSISCGGDAPVGVAWQCVELAQRLYYRRGWYTANTGRFGVSYAYQIYDVAAGNGMITHDNGSGYIPVPGDMIIHNKGPNPGSNNNAGHVAVVDYVDGSGVHVVEQNYASTAHMAVYGLSSSALSRTLYNRDGSFAPIRGVVHDPDNALVASRDLAFVKWAPTGSGRIEVHTATATSGYTGFGVHAATPIGAGDTNGVFDMADVNADGRVDLVYIKRRNTGSGRIEVHWVNAATGYSSFGGNIATVFSAADDPNGSFEMADMNGDGRADLVFTKTRNTGSGRIELHWADAASGYTRFGANLATAFSLADAGNGYFHPADMNADGRVDLAFVKIRNTGSGRIEVHWANAAAGYGSFGGNFATALSAAERTNGWFETVDMNSDRRADLVFLKDYNVGSGRIELHWLDAGAGFSRVTFSAATAFSAAEAGHGFFTMMA